MILCEFPQPFGSRCSCLLSLGLLLLVLQFATAADRPETINSAGETAWTEELPGAQTRIYWASPDFLSLKAPLIFSQGAADSMPLSRNETPPAKWFGVMDWLSNRQDKPEFDFARDPVIIRAENGWTGSAEPKITFVRGGPPQLFGARGRIRGEYGDEFNDVKRIRGQVLLNLIGNHIGVDASGNSWEDNRPRPESLGDFWTGDANLVYSMGAQRVAMRGGAGASWVYDEEFDVGFNTTYGADLFLTRPWLVSGEIDYGKINNEKLFHWRATFGVQLLHMEVYLGYDSYKWNHIRFDGPVAGAGIWF